MSLRTVRPRASRGWTLPELLLATLVAAIIASWALAPLRHAVLQARRVAASATLLQLSLHQERHRAVHGRYAADLIELGWADARTACTPPGACAYELRLHARSADGDDYELQALPLRGQGDDRCGVLRVDHLGRRAAAAPDCW